MTKAKRRRRSRRPEKQVTPGTAPGALDVDPSALPTTLRVFEYDEARCDEQLVAVDALARPVAGHRAWIDVVGLGDAAALSKVAATFGLHALSLEDVVHTHQRPKAEAYDRTLFVVVRIPSRGERESEQLSLFMTADVVITFQEGPTPVLDAVRDRLRRGGARIRASGVDYLAYAILDAVIDSYRPELDVFIARVEAVEDDLAGRSDEDVVQRLHGIRNELITIRRIVLPVRDVINVILRDDPALVSPATRVFWRDCQDHVHQLADDIETERELVNGLVDVHLSLVGHGLNEVMKLLTIIATIFIPLSFITGVYGMNFDTEVSRLNMPELRHPWGYPIVLLVMAAVAGGMLLYFWRRGWILSPSSAGVRPRRDASR